MVHVYVCVIFYFILLILKEWKFSYLYSYLQSVYDCAIKLEEEKKQGCHEKEHVKGRILARSWLCSLV